MPFSADCCPYPHWVEWEQTVKPPSSHCRAYMFSGSPFCEPMNTPGTKEGFRLAPRDPSVVLTHTAVVVGKHFTCLLLVV